MPPEVWIAVAVWIGASIGLALIWTILAYTLSYFRHRKDKS